MPGEGNRNPPRKGFPLFLGLLVAVAFIVGCNQNGGTQPPTASATSVAMGSNTDSVIVVVSSSATTTYTDPDSFLQSSTVACTHGASVGYRGGMMYCDGSDFHAMNSTSVSQPCTSLGQTTVVGNDILFCDGATYHSMKGKDLNTSCTTPGQTSFSGAFPTVCLGSELYSLASTKSSTATATASACGTASGSAFGAAPTSGLCGGSYSASAVTASGAQWLWTCSSPLDPPVSCSAISSAPPSSCGSAQGGTFASAPSSNLCGSGFNLYGMVRTDAFGNWTWTCISAVMGGAPAACTATNSSNLCGVANGGSYPSVPPTADLCNATSSAPYPSFSGGVYTWTCQDGSGNTSNCSATQAPGGGAPIH